MRLREAGIGAIQIVVLAAVCFFYSPPVRAAEPSWRDLHSGCQFPMPGGADMAGHADPQRYVLPALSPQNGGNEEHIGTAPYARKAPYQYGWDWGPRFVTEGIWRPIRVETWDSLRIENLHIHQERVGKDLAKIAVEVEVEASQPATATIVVTHE